ncbi:lipid A biosynthesis acyltransferase [candidate division KSB3 bacterium]|uniref:Lipid A biosynthesis acyltransferase n=1 Tax=candidate division KSB3 bacterium TaxID=2044937 RepID=A0A9D5Q7X8_9BACT|nr:lipid A biosynthesis acyltransferase [candidate division KSB3 bacterium]MBD3326908.1 lipid A biosynthesis acyltransferase [candidate division KSB3 bacterium]
MKRQKHRFIQYLEYFGALTLAVPFYLLPRKLAFRAGEQIGELMYRTMRRRRQIGDTNLSIAFGDALSDQEKARILRSTFRNLGKSLVELLHFPKMSKAYLQEKVQIVGQENYLAAMRKGKGMIYLTAHIGNWEMSSHAQSAAGYPLNIVVRPLDNPLLDKMVTKLRTLHGNTVLTRGHGLKQILAALRKKQAVGILMDQNTLRSRGIFVEFFGKPACTIPVIALLALRYDVPVIPGFIVRTGFDTHALHLGPEIEIQRTGDTQRDIAANTARFNQIIEDFIRRYPDQWFWIHNRWKTQPRNAERSELFDENRKMY